jgi:predicted AlkP superfamily pyrophosphatase or phosphodiesterase
MAALFMKRLVSLSLLLLAAFAASSCTTPPVRPAADRLILISIDGFRWDYLQKYDAPALKALAAGGVHAKRMTPSFPSKTFPNHYTLVTGLYPEHHGIVSNYFFDPALNASFNKNLPSDNADPRWWQEGEPIWITAGKQGVRTACYMWPSDEAEIHGRRPDYVQPYDFRITTSQRAAGLLHWLDLPATQRPRFCALYFEVVDHFGHQAGPDSPAMAAAVKEADDAIAQLVAGLAARGLRDTTDIVVVSDHGMATQSADRVVFLDDLVDLSQVQVESTGPNGGVRPKPGTMTAAELAAHMRAKAPPQVHIYLREEVPARFNYRDNPRIPPVVFIADNHWNVELGSLVEKYKGHYEPGNHGWDPATPDMGALFIANGPSFKRGHEFADVENVHLYNLLCAALGIKPAPNDGDNRLVREALAR